MNISHRNLAMILMGVVVMSTSGVYSLTQSAPTQTNTGTTEQPVVLGHLELVAKDKDGNIKAYRQTDNLVVSNGLNSTINDLFGSGLQTITASTVHTFDYVGVGTSNQAVAYGDSVLKAQDANRLLGTVTAINAGGGTGMGAQIVATWGAGKLANATTGSQTIQEAGLFDADNTTNAGGNPGVSSQANLYAHQVISPGIAIGTSDTLTVTWKITFSHS
jgi:hypothetical protein